MFSSLVEVKIDDIPESLQECELSACSPPPRRSERALTDGHATASTLQPEPTPDLWGRVAARCRAQVFSVLQVEAPNCRLGFSLTSQQQGVQGSQSASTCSSWSHKNFTFQLLIWDHLKPPHGECGPSQGPGLLPVLSEPSPVPRPVSEHEKTSPGLSPRSR